jgi:UDPglucose--hexose-1-phosphate uridylyltransferase
MDLRKDPITRSWVVVGHSEKDKIPLEPCPLCPDTRIESHVLLALPREGAWQVRAFPHLRPLYRIEGEPSRAADGIYDRMAPVGAHEIIVETPEHSRQLCDMSDEEIGRVLDVYSLRIADLKRDLRFKYVTIFKNRGTLAGEEWPHSHSQVTATTFVPRRVLYELRAAREWFREHDRCVFCDILRQEVRQGKRIVDGQGDYVAFCPYASRVPYEFWLMPRRHNHLFEVASPGENRRNLASLLGRTIRRLRQVTMAYHLVLHTAPNTIQRKGEMLDYWKTIADDYHWHFEVMPIIEGRNKSYSIKEVYFNALLPEQAAEQLRQLDPTA